MEIKRSGSQPSRKGPDEYFTGTVRIDLLVQTSDPARALGVSVTLMKLFAATVISLSLLASASAQTDQAGAVSGTGAATSASVQDSQTIKITRSGSQPSRQAPAENFTGSVSVAPLFQANDPARASGACVTFEPGARTAWHAHPLGQTLIVTAGIGRVQRWGDPVAEIRQGDVVWIPPGQKHWHGASPNTVTHIAIVERLDGKTVEWMEKVSDAQYRAPIRAQGAASAAAPARSASGASTQPRPSKRSIGDFSPKLAELTDDALYGDFRGQGSLPEEMTPDRRRSSDFSKVRGREVEMDIKKVAHSLPVKDRTSIVFFSKLNASGTVLIYSTYMGGFSVDYGRSVAVDTFGNAYLTGEAGSADFPTTAGTFQPTFNGNSFTDGFIAKFSGLAPFDLCLQDDSSGNFLQLNTTTGEYQFTNCGALTIGGTGIVTKRGNQITLQQNASDRRVLAKTDTSTNKATASVQFFSTGAVYRIMDRNITNNTCGCR